VRGAIDGLAHDVASQAVRLPAAWRAGWTNFLLRWGAFVDQYPPGWLSDAAASFFSGPWDRLMRFGKGQRAWRASFVFYGGTPSTPDTSPEPPELPGFGDGPSGLGIGIGLGVLLLLGLYLKR